MKKISYLLSTLALVLFVSGNACGQDYTVSAEVVTSVEYDESQDLNFGLISSDITTNEPEIDPTGGTHENVTGGNQTIGYVKFIGSENASFKIDNIGARLDNGTHSVNFTPTYCLDNSDTTGEVGCQSTAVNNGDGVEIVDGSFSGIGTLWIGGILSDPQDGAGQEASSLSSGSYENNITISVDYTF